MELIHDQLNQTEERIEVIEDFIVLSLKRDDISENARNLLAESKKVSDLMVEAHKCMQDELGALNARFDKVMRHMRQQQHIILDHVVNTIKCKKQEAAEEERQIKEALSCSTLNYSSTKSRLPTSAKSQSKAMAHGNSAAKLMPHLARLNLSQCGLTPKISISEYKQSPLVKRKMNPTSLTFCDFDYHISRAQFESIPKYMRGRETYDEFKSFFETIIVTCFNEKYQLLYRERNSVKNLQDLDLWKLYKEQASYVTGRNFITAGDISRKIKKMLDKKIQNRITMLRHIGILQEQRVAQTVCYIWVHNSF